MPEETAPELKPIALPASVTVKKLAELLAVPVPALITELMKNGILATINEEIDFETASVIATDLGFEAEEIQESDASGSLTPESLSKILAEEKNSGKNLAPRAPIVTILGHVDHGKTTLLDTIRKASVALGEAGGITQHLSAYQVKRHKKAITFLDTPGHEAFAAMRKRGLSIADIAILVVAADDGVRPQTKEVIAYIKERRLPVIVAINKIDKPDADAPRVKQELAENGILFEGWGGDTIAVEISAKNNINIDTLLESILLLAEVEDFRADAKRDGLAVVLESHLDPQKGPVATALVRTGELKIGQDVVAGGTFGRIRRIEDFTGRSIESAGPSVPATPLRLQRRSPSKRHHPSRKRQRFGPHQIPRSASQGRSACQRRQNQVPGRGRGRNRTPKTLAPAQSRCPGSLEAVEQILNTLQSDEIELEMLGSGVGSITESDVRLAASAHALIVGFNTDPTPVAKRLAETSGVTIERYDIIYKLVEAIKDKLATLLPPEIVRTDSGKLSVLAIFKTGKRDMIVGGRVSEGKLLRGSMIEVMRDGESLGHGRMANLQQNKQNVDEVGQGNECGVVFEGSIKIAVGDTLIIYKEEEKKRTL
ncbi:MAG: translation initiation factor IF-2 N-terminal domain-containing protein [Candidatus Moraniibacteriota bacterium]